MTIFDEHSISDIKDVQETHGYSQVLAMTRLRALHEANRLDSQEWQRLQIMVSDRRWIHALKLGLLDEDEYHEGGRDNDNEIEPNHVLVESPEIVVEEQAIVVPPGIEISEAVVEDEQESERELTELEEVISSELESDGDVAEVAKEEDSSVDISPDVDDNATKEAGSDDSDASGDLNETSENNDTIVETSYEEEEEEESLSPFVKWLNALPGTPTRASAKKSSGKKEKKKAAKKDKKEEKKKKKSDKKKEGKKKKSKKGKKKKSEKKSSKKKKKDDEDVPFQDRIVNSLLLNDNVSSETLAQLLTEHGHLQLAKEMYQRLAVKYPEKSSYFAAQIQQLNEE